MTAAGVTGTFGTITRSDGSTQATFDGHPLYTFVGDTAPGQAKGNGLNAAGGLWHEITTSGTAPAAAASSGSGGGRLLILSRAGHPNHDRTDGRDDTAGHHDQAGTDPGAPGAGNQHAEPPGFDWRTVMLRVAGAGLLIAAGAIHLDLYLTGYRTIPTIGWLFLLQVIVAFALGLAVLAIGRPVIARRLAAAAGAGFALATLGGYLLTVWIGLFGFKEVRTTAGIVAGVIEVAAFAVLAALALAPARADAAARARPTARGPVRIPHPDPPGDRPGGRGDRRGPGRRGAGAARRRRSRGQYSRASRHQHGTGTSTARA